MTVEEFVQRLAVDNIFLSEIQVDQFHRYAESLLEWNKKINLTALTELSDIYEKHFYDSLLPFIKQKPQGTLCDVGSGAGFPGVVIKIVYPDVKVILLEPIKKRVVFLNDLLIKLDLGDIAVVNSRAEDYVKIKRETFDWVTARAVANLAILAELCIPLVKLDGYFIAMKGSNGLVEYQDASKGIHQLGCELLDEGKMMLNSEIYRYNLLFIKKHKTPISYPRSYALIKKRPL